MLDFPNIDPVAFSLGPVKVHWYGLMYMLGFVGAWGIALWRSKHYHLPWTSEQIGDLIFYGALGVILGGRIGYMVFYNWPELVHAPLSLFAVWQGGMSFHGGLIGVITALCLFAYKSEKKLLDVTDFVAPLVPLGLAAGRIGNFINGELWGREAHVPWAMIFPNGGPVPRHPSQLYEFALEGIALFILLWCYASRRRPRGCVSAVFLIGYSIARLFVECFRAPDAQLGYLAFGWLTMGQLLSIPMLLLGLYLWWKKRNENLPETT